VTAVANRPPLAVLVGGAPGTGKTTLAGLLADALDVPVVHKDRLVHGTWRTLERALNLGVSGVELFYRTMELWADLGVSFVADQTFYRGVSEPDIERRLSGRAVVVQVHCASRHGLDRFEDRMRRDPLCGEARLHELLPLARRLQSELAEPLELACPLIEVNTDEGYRPAIVDIVGEIDTLYGRPTVHDLDRPHPLT
jgi:chloramphenicol 3-O-phosphotransferase